MLEASAFRTDRTFGYLIWERYTKARVGVLVGGIALQIGMPRLIRFVSCWFDGRCFSRCRCLFPRCLEVRGFVSRKSTAPCRSGRLWVPVSSRFYDVRSCHSLKPANGTLFADRDRNKAVVLERYCSHGVDITATRVEMVTAETLRNRHRWCQLRTISYVE